jgi:hypothetical protein
MTSGGRRVGSGAPVSLRYGVGPLTGYVSEESRGKPPTIWYVHDRVYLSQVVAVYETEYEARRDALRRNAEERRWEKSDE